MKSFQDDTAALANLHLVDVPPDDAGIALAGLFGKAAKVAIEPVDIN